MKRNSIYMSLVVLLFTLLEGCSLNNAYDYSPYLHFQMEETCHLTDDTSSPYCDFSLYYSYLDEEDDSIAMVINRTIQQEFLGEDYFSLIPEVALDSFKNTYLRNYREGTGELYLADKIKAASDETIPNWYNQTYSMVTAVGEGYKGIVNASANMFLDAGGAHPHQWSRWLNFDFVTGKFLNKEDVFESSAQKYIEECLLRKLIQVQAELHPDKQVASLEDLRELGILQSTEIYIPDNFLLDKEHVLFLYNRYDIAPYSSGAIELELSYEEIGQYLKL